VDDLLYFVFFLAVDYDRCSILNPRGSALVYVVRVCLLEMNDEYDRMDSPRRRQIKLPATPLDVCVV
jgi:hypothetical protein